MGVRIKYQNQSDTETTIQPPEFVDSTQDQRETTADGYTFHWGPNQARNFIDDGVGLLHALNKPGISGGTIARDTIPFNDAMS